MKFTNTNYQDQIIKSLITYGELSGREIWLDILDRRELSGLKNGFIKKSKITYNLGVLIRLKRIRMVRIDLIDYKYTRIYALNN